MKMDIVLGWDGHAITGGRMKRPVTQYRDHALIHARPQPLKQLLFHDGALRINGDLHDYVTLYASRKLGARDSQILKSNRERGLDLVAAGGTILACAKL